MIILWCIRKIFELSSSLCALFSPSLSLSLQRWGAWCHFNASQGIWFRALPPEPASRIWRGAEHNLSAYVWNKHLFHLLTYRPSFCCLSNSNSTAQNPLSTLQRMLVSSQRARSMWTWWGWICLVLATLWCTAVSMATSWREVQSTESARVMGLGRERCLYVEVKKIKQC